jgi:hypothetical protein
MEERMIYAATAIFFLIVGYFIGRNIGHSEGYADSMRVEWRIRQNQARLDGKSPSCWEDATLAEIYATYGFDYEKMIR